MPEKRKIRLNNIVAVPVGTTGVATIDVPLSFGRCHEIQFQSAYTGATIADAATKISEIRVVVNGTVIRTMSGTDLRDQNLLNGSGYDCLLTAAGGINPSPVVNFPIFFAEPWRKDARDQDALAWASAPMNSFRVEITMTGGALQTLTAFAIVDDVTVRTNPLYVKWIKQTFNGSGSSVDISNIDRRGWLQQVSLYATATSLDAVVVKKDANIIAELTRIQNSVILSTHGMLPNGGTRNANVFDIVFDHDDLLGSSVDLNGARDLVISLTGTAIGSGTLVGIIQRLEKLDGTVG